MTENQIKVNNLEELTSKAREYVASQGGSEKVSLGKTAAVSDTLTYTKDKGMIPTKKGGIEVKLHGQNGSSANFFLETDSEGEEKNFDGKIIFEPHKFKVRAESFKKVLAELNKIIPDKRPTPPPNQNSNEKDNFQPHSLSIVAIPCSNLGEVKEQINKYYQENKLAITQNPDFSRWIDITEVGLHTNYSEVDKNGKTISEGPHNTATIILRGGQNRKEDGKIVNKQISLLLKVETDSEEWIKEDFFVTWPEKQLKDYWNSLVGKKEEKKNIPPKSPSEIEQLRSEISELENNSPNDSEKQKELSEKREKLNELEKNTEIAPSKSNSNLAIYLSLGGIALLVGLIFLVRLVRKKSK